MPSFAIKDGPRILFGKRELFGEGDYFRDLGLPRDALPEQINARVVDVAASMLGRYPDAEARIARLEEVRAMLLDSRSRAVYTFIVERGLGLVTISGALVLAFAIAYLKWDSFPAELSAPAKHRVAMVPSGDVAMKVADVMRRHEAAFTAAFAEGEQIGEAMKALDAIPAGTASALPACDSLRSDAWWFLSEKRSYYRSTSAASPRPYVEAKGKLKLSLALCEPHLGEAVRLSAWIN